MDFASYFSDDPLQNIFGSKKFGDNLDDFVHCSIFRLPGATFSSADLMNFWSQHCGISEYIWYRDPLCVEEGDPSESEGLGHLAVHLRYGDCVGDEWLVVHLVLEATKKFEGMVAQVKEKKYNPSFAQEFWGALK